MRNGTKIALCAALVLPVTAAWANKTEKTEKKTDTVETASGKRTTASADASSAADRKFVEKAASGGMAEVKLGKLAMEKGTSPTVKEFGQKMVEDHSKANDELKQIAERKNMTLPTEVDSAHKKTYDKLEKMSGADFDKAYMDAMVKDHDDDVKEFKKATSTAGTDPDLKAWAEKTLSVIEQHDHIAHQDKDAIKK